MYYVPDGHKSLPSLDRLDNIFDDCILGSPFLQKVSLTTMDIEKMLFHFYLNGKKVSCPLSYSKKPRCPRVLEQEKSVNTSELFKLDRSVIFAELHKENALAEISKK